MTSNRSILLSMAVKRGDCADTLCAGEKASDFDNGFNTVLRGLLTCDFKHLKC